MKGKYLLTSLIIALCLTSCNKEEGWDCLKKSGPEITELRTLENFNEVYIEDKIDVILKPSSVYEVEVTFGKNILPKITSNVIDGKLYLKNEATCDMVRNLKERPVVTIGFPSISHIEYSGSGDISCVDSLRGPSFTFEQWNGSGNVDLISTSDTLKILLHTGHGNVKVSGTSVLSEYYSNAVGGIDAREVSAEVCLVNNSGVNSIYLTVSDYLYSYIGGSGNVYYRGEPSIEQTGDGKGSLIPF